MSSGDPSSGRSQTRGFMFADLRGYSAFTERHGDEAARELLGRYRAVVREVIGQAGGAEIRTEGDSFYVVFTSVAQAVLAGLAILAAAQAATNRPGTHPIRIGIGVHAGETVDSTDGIVSSAVNIAARICSVAGAGELLVSDTVRSLTRTHLDVAFVNRGRRRLKGIAEPVLVYGVKAAAAGGQRGAIAGPIGWSPRSRWVLVGGAAALAAVAVALATIGGILMRAGLAQDGPSASIPPLMLSPSALSSPVVAPSTSLAPFPMAVEEDLLGFLDESSRDRCSRTGEGPAYVAVRDTRFEPIKVAYVAGIDCALGGLNAPDQLRIWLLQATAGAGRGMDSPRIAPRAIVGQKADANAAPRTSCGQEVPAREEWSFGDASGLLFCYETVTGDAILWWNYDGTEIIATAVRDDRDMAALLRWWTAEARFAP